MICSFCNKEFINPKSFTNHRRWHIPRFAKRLRESMRITKLSNRNPMWKGERVSIKALHGWVKYRLEKPNKCSECKRKVGLDLANISQKYKRDLEDWEWLCRRCHMTKDGRMKNLELGRVKGIRGVKY